MESSGKITRHGKKEATQRTEVPQPAVSNKLPESERSLCNKKDAPVEWALTLF